MVMATVTLCAGLVLATVTTPEYAPAASPLGSAMMLIEAEAKALTVALDAEVFSQAPPELVEVEMLQSKDPPPIFEIDSAREFAAAPCTNEKTIEVGFKLRLGCPGAVAVSVTEMVRAPGDAFGVVIVMVP